MTWRGGEPAAAAARDPACLNVFAGGQAAQDWLEPGGRLSGRLAGRTIFAGEYSSPGFYGYIGGGLLSGAVLAGRLAHRFNLVKTG